jgi:DNA-binding NtrC family response regulator
MRKKEKILIVDDDMALQESLVSILENDGYFIEAAKTGQEAVGKVKSGYYNLALLDIRLPDMTGIELLTKINVLAPRTKKLVLTGYPDASSAIRAVNEKADAYLVKPCDPVELIALIEEHLKIQREELEYTQEKVLEYIQNRVKELDTPN